MNGHCAHGWQYGCTTLGDVKGCYRCDLEEARDQLVKLRLSRGLPEREKPPLGNPKHVIPSTWAEPKSILQPWVMLQGLRHQGVLVSALRGCDTAPRHDPSKIAQRILRGALLEPHCGRFANPLTYIVVESDESKWWAAMKPFLESWDHYPNHYVAHFIHATEIIGYKGPEEKELQYGHRRVFPYRWRDFYFGACHKLHLNPETEEQLDYRLTLEENLFAERQQYIPGHDKVEQNS